MKRYAVEAEGLLELEGLRKQIDEIDREILSLLFHRQETAVSIGDRKKTLGLDRVDPLREKEILQSLTAQENALLKGSAIRSIFSEIISAGREVQEAGKVAYLGPEATFSHLAATAMFGHSTAFLPAGSLSELFNLVETGRCSEGIVPLENSLEGSVGVAHDLLYTHDLKIRAEIILRVRHHLLSKANRLGEIARIYSHPMAFFQCGTWLKRQLSKAVMIDTPSTAAAAMKASEDPASAAIGSRLASDSYAIPILASDIEDSPHNLTRFLSVGKDSREPTGDDKTSIVLSVKHEPGALFKAMQPFASRSINMTRIVSRPFKGRTWEYLFFMDLEGHVQDDPLGRALEETGLLCQWMKVLGSYPKGGDTWE